VLTKETKIRHVFSNCEKVSSKAVRCEEEPKTVKKRADETGLLSFCESAQSEQNWPTDYIFAARRSIFS